MTSLAPAEDGTLRVVVVDDATVIRESLPALLPDLLEAYRTGRGIDWAEYGPDVVEAQEAINRPQFHHLVGDWIDALPDIAQRLRSGRRERAPPGRAEHVAQLLPQRRGLWGDVREILPERVKKAAEFHVTQYDPRRAERQKSQSRGTMAPRASTQLDIAPPRGFLSGQGEPAGEASSTRSTRVVGSAGAKPAADRGTWSAAGTTPSLRIRLGP